MVVNGLFIDRRRYARSCGGRLLISLGQRRSNRAARQLRSGGGRARDGGKLTFGILCNSNKNFRQPAAHSSPDAMLIINARRVVLKKNASTQCTVPVLRIRRLEKLTSAVCPEVPMTQAKYRKSP